MAVKYTNISLFNKVVEILKEKGFYPENILDYELADNYHPIEIISEEWSTMFKLNYGGSEGIYLDIYSTGNVSSIEKESTIRLGSFKTLQKSDEAMLQMAILAGHIEIEIHKFVNENMDDFTWYGGNVYVKKETGELKSCLTCGNLERALKKAREIEDRNGSLCVVRDNNTRKLYLSDGITKYNDK